MAPVDTKLRALHLSALLHEKGQDFHVEDDGGVAIICDEEGNKLFNIQAAAMADLCAYSDEHAVAMLRQLYQIHGAAYMKGHRRGLEQGEEHAARQLQRMLGLDRIADELTQARKAVERFAAASQRQAG